MIVASPNSLPRHRKSQSTVSLKCCRHPNAINMESSQARSKAEDMATRGEKAVGCDLKHGFTHHEGMNGRRPHKKIWMSPVHLWRWTEI